MRWTARAKFPGNQWRNPGNQLMDKVRRETFPDKKGYARSGVLIGVYREILIFLPQKKTSIM
jgi:hypothetical protein